MDGFSGFKTATADELPDAVPSALVEIRRLGRTLKQCAADILAFFDRPVISKRPHRVNRPGFDGGSRTDEG
jgi:hypothetical protein